MSEEEGPKLKTIPAHITKEIANFALEQGYGFAQIVTQDMTLLVMGRKDLSPDQVAIIAAHALLLGVLEGGFTELNQKQREVEKRSIN